MSLALRIFIIGIPIERVHITRTEVIFGKEGLLVQSFINEIELVRTGRLVVERVSYRRDDCGRQAPPETAGLNDGGATLVDVIGAEIHAEELWRVYI